MSVLAPRAPAGTTVPSDATWRSDSVPAPEAWRRRTGRRRDRTWTVRSRSWAPAGTARRRVPVVVVHGLGVGSAMSAPLAEELAVDGPVHAPDLVGFGRSSKPRPVLDVTELGDVLASWVRRAVDPAPVLVGTSLGSQVALAAATRHPDAVRGVVLVSPTVDARRRRWSSQIPRWQVEGATQSLRLRLLQVRDYARAGVPRVVRTFRHAMRHRPEDEIRGLQVPALVVHARRDPLLRREWAAHLAHSAPDGALATLPRGVHAASHENPVELARLVNGFLEDVGAGPARRDERGRAA